MGAEHKNVELCFEGYSRDLKLSGYRFKISCVADKYISESDLFGFFVLRKMAKSVFLTSGGILEILPEIIEDEARVEALWNSPQVQACWSEFLATLPWGVKVWTSNIQIAERLLLLLSLSRFHQDLIRF